MSSKNKPPTDAELHADDAAPPAPAAPTESAAPPEDELTTLRREVTELRDKNLRLLAESQNQHKRMQREKQELQRYAEAELARDLLVVLDDLERTQAAAEAATDMRTVADGVRIVIEHFLKIFRDHGVTPIEAVGRPFDPTCHEALLQQPSADHPAGTVLHEATRGYQMHGRVLRPSRVIVSAGPASSEPPGQEAPES